MTLLRMVISNQLFYIRKVVLVILLTGLMLFLPLASVILIDHAKGLAEKPLQMLQTELILQYDKTGRDYKDIRTEGVILPFNLKPIPLKTIEDNLKSVKEVRAFSTALVLWDFDLGNTRTMIALRTEEPQTGMRKIESLLMKGGRFFEKNDVSEVILERHYAKLFGYDLGGAFKLKDEEFKIVGIVDFKEQSNLSSASIFLPYGTALRLSGQKEQVVNQAFLSLQSSGDTTEAARKVEVLFPGASLITKDSLYKNLSGINRLLYQSGRYFMAVIIPIALLLVVWTFKIHRLDFRYQTDILKTIGWQRRDVFLWLFTDTAVMACLAVFIAVVLSIILQKQILPSLATMPLLNQGFTL